MITSLSNPRIKRAAQWQKQARERREAGVFLAEGFKMYEEAPDDMILEVYMTEEALRRVESGEALAGKLHRTGYETVSGEVFDKISDTRTPQGILTVLRRPQYRLEELLLQPNPLFVVLEDIQDPGNLGTIIRTGEGAGITGVIINCGTVDLFNPKTIRATMGSVYRVPFICAQDLAETLRRLHDSGVRIYAAHLNGKSFYDSFSFREPSAFLIGNEGQGLRQPTAELADAYLRIPMEGRVESLNAAVAASLLMYEARRQRKDI